MLQAAQKQKPPPHPQGLMHRSRLGAWANLVGRVAGIRRLGSASRVRALPPLRACFSISNGSAQTGPQCPSALSELQLSFKNTKGSCI